MQLFQGESKINSDQTKLDSQRQLAVAMRRLQNLERSRAFDPFHLETRPTPQQDEILHAIGEVRRRYVMGGNQSGKSQLGGRECAWVFTGTHPHWQRPAAWGAEPLTMMIVGRTTAQYRELWEKKVRPFLAADEYKEYNSGTILERVVNPKNGNTILFFSHHAPDEAREKVQMFVAHWLWLDEMPKSFRLLEELHRRCQSKRAPFLATFTPKAINTEIRYHIEQMNTIHRKYSLHTLENPIYKDPARMAELLEEHEGYSIELRKTVLFGEWYGGELAVYDFQPERDIEAPPGYGPSWRHIEIVDPAASGKAGVMLLAEDPRSWKWYVVMAKYLDGAAASDLLDSVDQETRSYNVYRRVSDPHEAWFIKEAAKRKRGYNGVFKKNERKKELIKNLQEGLLARQLKIAPWCDLVIDEFNTCQWSETVADKIVGAPRFHLLDCLQYGWDNRPKPDRDLIPKTFDQALKVANQQRRINEAQRKERKSRFARIQRGRRWAK